MINLLLGIPGGGKSYEATVFHVLPALAKGRKVITNLPLVLDAFAKIDPSYPDLIEIRTETKATKPDLAQSWNSFPFSHVEDYGDTWRHPETGAGPLYVIDECHIALPRIGTPLDVEHWFSLHRHETADVLLMTQSYGKINAAVRDLVQVVYRVRKNIALGSETTYTRKVQDGLRGEVVNTSIRKYEPRYFSLYHSHTKGGGQEMQAQDVRPIWMHWSFIGSACLLFSALAYIVFGDFSVPFLAPEKPLSHPVAKPDRASQIPVTASPSPAQALPPEKPVPPDQPNPPVQTASHPFDGKQVHILGTILSRLGDAPLTRTFFAISQNGLVFTTLSDADLLMAGLTYRPLGPCAGELVYGTVSRLVYCDVPRQAINPSIGLVGGEGSPPAGRVPPTPPNPT